MKILVIEDEIKLAEYLKKGLGEAGHNVDIVHNGVDGLHMALEGGYDLLILDGMLPGIDGFTLLTAFRKTKQTPVLMLTARVSVEDRVRGLQTGADDYLVKPFAFSELSARVQVLLRRAHGAKDAGEPTVLGIANLELDLIRRKARSASTIPAAESRRSRSMSPVFVTCFGKVPVSISRRNSNGTLLPLHRVDVLRPDRRPDPDAVTRGTV